MTHTQIADPDEAPPRLNRIPRIHSRHIGADDDLACACGIVHWVIAALAMWLIVALAFCAVLWP